MAHLQRKKSVEPSSMREPDAPPAGPLVRLGVEDQALATIAKRESPRPPPGDVTTFQEIASLQYLLSLIHI